MVKRIDVADEDMELIRAIVNHQVPEYEVYAFGSRVKGMTAKHSDLDLVIMTEKPLSTERMADLKDAFMNSDLPFKVDVVDWAETKERFREIIRREAVAVKKNKF